MAAMRWILPLVVALAACSHSASSPPPPQQQPSSWHVSGGFVRDPQGRAVVMRGVNMSGQNKSAPYLGSQTADDYQRVRRSFGMNAVRFLLLWAAIEPQPGQYDDAYLDKVAERMKWATDADLLVVLDMHRDVYGEGFASGGGDGAPRWTCDASNYAGFTRTDPWALENLEAGVVACDDGFWSSDDLQSHYAEAWRRVAARLAGYDAIVGFDPMNEPYWGSHSILGFEQDLLEPMYERVVPIVRSAAPHWVAFVEPSSSRNLGGTTRLTTPSFGDFAYAPHSYDRDAESGKGFAPAQRGAILSNVASLAQEANALGGALWIGEYGGTAKSPGIVEYMTAQYDAAGAVAASSMYWDYARGGYGMLAYDGSDAQPLDATLVRPYPERVAGDPVSWSWDDATSTFTFTYRADANVSAPTVLSVPARLYPKGFHVDCGGCANEVDGASLLVTSPPTGDPAVVVVSPG